MYNYIICACVCVCVCVSERPQEGTDEKRPSRQLIPDIVASGAWHTLWVDTEGAVCCVCCVCCVCVLCVCCVYFV